MVYQNDGFYSQQFQNCRSPVPSEKLLQVVVVVVVIERDVSLQRLVYIVWVCLKAVI